jgi:hypothetical protein
MIDKDVLNEIVREAFQDFDLLDYTYSIRLQSYVELTNKNGSINQVNPSFDNYIELYNNHRPRRPIVTYKDVLSINLRFKPKTILDKEELDEFFLDGCIKLNHLLIEYNIEIPTTNKLHYIEGTGEYSTSFDIYGDNREIVVEFSSKLKV